MLSLFALLVALPFLLFIALSVFGGGQVFMPIFSWFWNLLHQWFNVEIDQTAISQIFAIGNATPGIISPKFALTTGYLVSNGQWWGFIAMFLTYFAFVSPGFLMMYFARKYTRKFDNNIYVKKLINIMNPIVTGIIVALAVQLFIGIMFPFINFNKSIANYMNASNNSDKAQFFGSWRKIVLYLYVPIGVVMSFIMYVKKIPIIGIIIWNIFFSLLIFMPWIG